MTEIHSNEEEVLNSLLAHTFTNEWVAHVQVEHAAKLERTLSITREKKQW